MDYNQEYQQHGAYFGEEPDTLLQRFWRRLEPTSGVLDLGAGQGRHALFLARHGLQVHAVEPSPAAAAAINDLVRQETLPIRVTCSAYEKLTSDGATYGGVLLFGLVQLQTPGGLEQLAAAVRRWTAPGGMVLLTAHGINDPAYDQIAAGSERLGRHSFRLTDGEIRTYVEPGELLALFPDFTVLHHWQGLGPEHSHGDSPPERHDRIEAVLRLPG